MTRVGSPSRATKALRRASAISAPVAKRWSGLLDMARTSSVSMMGGTSGRNVLAVAGWRLLWWAAMASDSVWKVNGSLLATNS